MHHNIEPRTQLEDTVLRHPDTQDALRFIYGHHGRKEKGLGEHIAHILSFIDFVDEPAYTSDLRFLAILHDFGKCRTKYDANGNLIGPSHAMLSAEFARNFTDDARMLTMVLKHDKYFKFYKQRRARGGLPEHKFRAIFADVDLPTLIRFNYVDSCDRGKEATVWFEDTCATMGLVREKVYLANPRVLATYDEASRQSDRMVPK